MVPVAPDSVNVNDTTVDADDTTANVCDSTANVDDTTANADDTTTNVGDSTATGGGGRSSTPASETDESDASGTKATRTRRGLVSAAGVAVLSTAGCLGPGLPEDATVTVSEQSPGSDASVVSGEDLTDPERQIVQTAIDEELYHACPDLPDALYRFAERFEAIESYLQYQGTTYGLWVRIEDTVRVDTAEPPDTRPNCGLL